MIPKLRFDTPVHLTNSFIEHDIVELFDHGSRGKSAEVTATFCGRARGIFLCSHCEIGTARDFFFDFKTSGFGFD